MIEWFQAGGVGMWPVALVGAMAFAVAARHAALPGAGWRRASRTLQVATVAFGAGGTALGVATTLHYAAGQAAQAAITEIGIAESLGCVELALVAVAVANLFLAAGDLRDAGAERT